MVRVARCVRTSVWAGVRAGVWVGACAWSFGGVGCATGLKEPVRSAPLAPLPLDEAIATVNANASRIGATLRGSGPVDGFFTTSAGRRVSYQVDGTFFYLPPAYVRFDLKKLGDRQLLFGSNTDAFWVYTKEDGKYFCGSPDDPRELPEGIPRPDQIADALGLSPVHEELSLDSFEFVSQRVEADHQELMFLERSLDGRAVVRKEYWLSRSLPRAVSRVVFRDPAGVLVMESVLRDYAPVGERGALLPRDMTAEWPRARARMRFQVARWAEVAEVRADGPQFATPRECDGRN